MFSCASSILSFLGRGFLRRSVFTFNVIRLLLVLLRFSSLICVKVKAGGRQRVRRIVCYFSYIMSFTRGGGVGVVRGTWGVFCARGGVSGGIGEYVVVAWVN